MSNNSPKSFVERVMDSVSNSVNSKVLFADPIEKDGITIIPVSRIRYGFGAGFARKKKQDASGKIAKGGGGGADAQPIGYIEIKDGEAKFRTINNPVSLPAVILAGGVASLFIFKGLARLFRK